MRKSKRQLEEDEIDEICYVCVEPVKGHHEYYCIGTDKDGKKIYRHCKCKPKPGELKIRKKNEVIL